MKPLVKSIVRWKYIFLFYTALFFSSSLIGLVAVNPQETSFNPESAYYMDLFANNMKVGLMLLFGGIMSGGVIPVIIISINGFIIGNVMNMAFSQGAYSSIIQGLLPHLFFELIALVSFAVIGSFSGYFLLKYVFNKTPKKLLEFGIFDAFRLFVLATCFLVIASFVEGFISEVNL